MTSRKFNKEDFKNIFFSCRQVESLRRKERSEAHLYMMVEVYLEDDFQCHQGSDLLDFEDVKPKYVIFQETDHIYLATLP